MKPGTAILISAVAVSLVSPMGGRGAHSEPLPVVVRLSLHSTDHNGATHSNGSAASNLVVGESSKLFAAAGQLHGQGPGCSTLTAAVSPSNADATAEAEAIVRSSLAGDGYLWEVEVTLQGLTHGDWGLESAAVRIAWTRTRVGGSERQIVEQVVDASLGMGARRLLEIVPFEPPSDDPSCRKDSIHLEIEVSPTAHPAMQGRDLVYELWFARTREGKREQFAATEIRAGQAEEVSFTLPALTQPLTAVAADGGDGPALRTQCKGAIRAWSTTPGMVAVRIEPSLHHRLGPPLGAGFSSGKGSKRYRAGLGETVELELPALDWVLTLPAESLDLRAPLADGVELDGSALRLDLARLLAGARYSLLVRVRAAS